MVLSMILFSGQMPDDYPQDIDSEEYFEGTEKIIPVNNWHKSGFDPKILSHGEYFKVEPGSTVKMDCQFTGLSGVEEWKNGMM